MLKQKVKNSSISAGSSYEVQYEKKQAGDFHDLQLHFLQLRLTLLLPESAPSPDFSAFPNILHWLVLPF